jgi:hypothetical protein
MTQSARAVWEMDIYLYSKVWLAIVIYAIFVVPGRCNDTR